MKTMTTAESDWEKAFDTLDKRVFSAEVIGGYEFDSFLEKYTTRDAQILDFGCGKGQLVRHFLKMGYSNIRGTDPSSFLIDEAADLGDRIRLLKDDRIPFDDRTFDFVYCSGVLHHIAWSQLSGVLSEVSRVLKPGGVFLVAEPRKTWLRSLGHLGVLSPLKHLSGDAKALADCLVAEWPTYKPWLDKEGKEFLPLCESQGFEVLEVERRPVTVVAVLQSRKPHS
jgi:ubiquinone/menaquinone biosynthesis C-methylase UbiE